MHSLQLPRDVVHVRTTEVFDERHHPAGLLRTHQVADGVWARLIVHTGTLQFAFDDDPDGPFIVSAGDAVVIPPLRLHHVAFDGPATFALEFHRQQAIAEPTAGEESTGLTT